MAFLLSLLGLRTVWCESRLRRRCHCTGPKEQWLNKRLSHIFLMINAVFSVRGFHLCNSRLISYGFERERRFVRSEKNDLQRHPFNCGHSYPPLIPTGFKEFRVIPWSYYMGLQSALLPLSTRMLEEISNIYIFRYISVWVELFPERSQ